MPEVLYFSYQQARDRSLFFSWWSSFDSGHSIYWNNFFLFVIIKICWTTSVFQHWTMWEIFQWSSVNATPSFQCIETLLLHEGVILTSINLKGLGNCQNFKTEKNNFSSKDYVLLQQRPRFTAAKAMFYCSKGHFLEKDFSLVLFIHNSSL